VISVLVFGDLVCMPRLNDRA